MRFLIAFLIFLSSAVAVSAQGLERGNAPDWVDDLPLPAVDAALQAQALDGVHYILSDHQTKWDGEDRISYGRTVLQVVDRAGLERAATISFEYDPQFDRIILTRLVVIRDGQEIDLRDTLTEEVLRREQRLEQGIIDGTLHLIARTVYAIGGYLKRFEEVVVSGGVDWVKDQFLSIAKEFRYLQTGKVQEYVLISVFIATALTVVILLINSGWLANIF